MEQRTEEWFSARLGKVTASRVADVLATTKTGYSTSRKNYMMELMVERLTNAKQESYTNSYMQHGIDNEPIARASYEQVISGLVHEVGFVMHQSVKGFGCSPDGLVGLDGLVEIKCPNTAQHVDTMLNGFPSRYQAQVQAQMACTKRSWCDFVSYDPRMPEHLSLVIIRQHADMGYIKNMENEITEFIEQLDSLVADVSKWKP